MKTLFRLIAVGLIVLVAVIAIRTLRFTSKQVKVSPAPAQALDQQALANRLAQALRFQTVSHQDPAALDREAFLGLQGYLAQQFPLVHARLKRETIHDYTLLFTWQGSDPVRRPIVLMSHLDVVPVEPGTEAKWSYPAFGGSIAEGFIWGRGALDDKFGVLAILEAVERLLQQDFQPSPTIYLAFGHDEEIGGDRGAKEVAALLRARGVDAEFVLDEGGAIVSGVVPNVSAPMALIGIAEKGNVSVDLTVRTEGGHSSSPPPHTAVGIVSAAVQNVENHPMPAGLRGPSRQTFEYVGPELPLWQRMVLANLWLFGGMLERFLTASPATNATLRTTTAATMIEGGIKDNVLPASARAVVNFRVLPGDSIDRVVEHVRQAVNDPRVEVQLTYPGNEASSESPTDTTSFALLARTIREVYPDAIVAPYLTIGGTDARHYSVISRNIYRFTPIVGTAADLARMHGTNERISVQDYARAVQFFMQLIKNSQ